MPRSQTSTLSGLRADRDKLDTNQLIAPALKELRTKLPEGITISDVKLGITKETNNYGLLTISINGVGSPDLANQQVTAAAVALGEAFNSVHKVPSRSTGSHEKIFGMDTPVSAKAGENSVTYSIVCKIPELAKSLDVTHQAGSIERMAGVISILRDTLSATQTKAAIDTGEKPDGTGQPGQSAVSKEVVASQVTERA